jgi:hypothetical protein
LEILEVRDHIGDIAVDGWKDNIKMDLREM